MQFLRQSALPVSVAALLMACLDRDATAPGTNGGPANLATGPGVATPPGFYFLPPMVPDPGPFSGTFDPNRHLTVRVVCTVATGPNCPVVATFDATKKGAAKLVVDLEEEHYKATWHTPASLELGSGRYRLEVMEGQSVLAQASLWVVSRRQDFRTMSAGYLGVVRGQPFLIKFRVETAAPPPPPPPPPTTAPSCRDCLEIVPQALLLPGMGHQHRLQAYLVDAAGVRTLVDASYTSSNPEHVVVTPADVAMATSPTGSSRITAHFDGRSSAPILAIVAAPAAGALLITDDQIVGEIAPETPGAKYGLGFRYRVRLQGAEPQPGQIVLNTGGLPVGGRAVRVTPLGGGVVETWLEVVPLGTMFSDLEVTQQFQLPATRVSRSSAGGQLPGFGGAAAVAGPALGAEFQRGPFKCEVSGGVGLTFPLLVDSYSWDVQTNLGFDFSVNRSGFQRALVTGSVSGQFMVNPAVAGEIAATIECRATIVKIPVPISGPLALILGGKIPVGVGFELEATTSAGYWGLETFLVGGVQGSMGIQCEPTCQVVTSLAPTPTDAFVKPTIPDFSHGIQVEVGASLFLFTGLELGNLFLDDVANLELLDAKAGVHQAADLASPLTQATDPQYAASLELSTLFEAGTTLDLEAIGGLLSIHLLEMSWEAPSLTLARSPTGTFTIEPAVVVTGDATSLGETATFTVTLDPVTFLGADAVESVEIRRLRQNEDNSWSLENGRPGCTSIPRTEPQQTVYTCQTDLLAEPEGLPQVYVAFVRARAYGLTLPILLEIHPDATVPVEVLRTGAINYEYDFLDREGWIRVHLQTDASLPVSGTGTLPASFTYNSVSTGPISTPPGSGMTCTTRVVNSGAGETTIRIAQVTLPSGLPGYELWYVPIYRGTGVMTCTTPDGSFTNTYPTYSPGNEVRLATGRPVRDAAGELIAIKFNTNRREDTFWVRVRGALKVGN